MNRGDIYLCDFGDPIGHEQGFRRPALIVSHDDMSRVGIPIVIPISRTRKDYPTHVELEGALAVTSYVQCEQIRVVSSERMIRRIGAVDAMPMLKVELILKRLLGLH
ncbi:type II toxin-antitoxin system PemK/MazF family toxin [Glycomyces terrestris]|uniref:mRNA interferase n=1 Tax=Glycomyces terrestris TaxID=2493553 RepID=A0A426UUT8_9ACTN|nr:type II toxin-antitoxin system PemK/MazF family toxin [Glycomyces terrestris]RRR97639.1 type II toxin-antitoxin system PemK/MazF family toxin [Glycomyces terrestris]